MGEPPEATAAPDEMPSLEPVLESAARFQELVPDAVLVGGSAAAYYARHRLSQDHDHVLADLRDRFDAVLDALEREDDWVTNRVVPGKLVLGRLGEIEAGVRQLIRKRPLEVEEVTLDSGRSVRVPTPDEILRVKAFLAVKRNQVRDYLDIAALSEKAGSADAARVLSAIDGYYADDSKADPDTVATQVARQLAHPRPADADLVDLTAYKELDSRWRDWESVVRRCQEVATRMLVDD